MLVNSKRSFQPFARSLSSSVSSSSPLSSSAGSSSRKTAASPPSSSANILSFKYTPEYVHSADYKYSWLYTNKNNYFVDRHGYDYATATSYKQPSEMITAENIKLYNTDPQTLARWLDFQVVKYRGRAYNADSKLISLNKANTFPTLKGVTLTGRNFELPHDTTGSVKFVVFSFKDYGWHLCRTWLDPFLDHFGGSDYCSKANSNDNITNTNFIGDKIGVYEICYVEHGFLSFAKSIFASNLKHICRPTQHERTVLVFGEALKFASQLMLPSKYIGYAVLLDRNNKIRWRGSGVSKPEELETVFKLTEELLLEEK